MLSECRHASPYARLSDHRVPDGSMRSSFTVACGPRTGEGSGLAHELIISVSSSRILEGNRVDMQRWQQDDPDGGQRFCKKPFLVQQSYVIFLLKGEMGRYGEEVTAVCPHSRLQVTRVKEDACVSKNI